MTMAYLMRVNNKEDRGAGFEVLWKRREAGRGRCDLETKSSRVVFGFKGEWSMKIRIIGSPIKFGPDEA